MKRFLLVVNLVWFVIVDFNIVINDVIFTVDLVLSKKVFDNRLILYVNQAWKNFSKCLSSTLKLVVWHQSEQVVDLMSSDVMDDAMNEAIVAIDSWQLSFNIVPLGIGEPWQLNWIVVQESDDDNVSSEYEAGDNVVVEQVEEAVGGTIEEHGGDPRGIRDQRAHDAHKVVLENFLEGIEVVDVAWAVSVEQVEPPSNWQTEAWWGWQTSKPLLGARIDFRFALWIKHLILIDIWCVVMVFAVSQFPWIEWSQNICMENGSNNVIYQWVRWETTMSAIVSQDEDRGVYSTLAKPVEWIEEPAVGRYHDFN